MQYDDHVVVYSTTTLTPRAFTFNLHHLPSGNICELEQPHRVHRREASPQKNSTSIERTQHYPFRNYLQIAMTPRVSNEGPKRGSKKLRLLGYTIIYVKVGEHLKNFGIRKELICHYSPCFEAAFNSGFEEATSVIIKLPGIEADISNHHIIGYTLKKWTCLFGIKVYRELRQSQRPRRVVTARLALMLHKVNLGLFGDGSDSDSNPIHYNDCPFPSLLQRTSDEARLLDFFADIAEIPKLQDQCIKAFYTIIELRLVDSNLNFVAEYIWVRTTTESSRLRRLMVGIMVWKYPSEYWDVENHEDDVLSFLLLKVMYEPLYRRLPVGTCSLPSELY